MKTGLTCDMLSPFSNVFLSDLILFDRKPTWTPARASDLWHVWLCWITVMLKTKDREWKICLVAHCYLTLSSLASPCLPWREGSCHIKTHAVKYTPLSLWLSPACWVNKTQVHFCPHIFYRWKSRLCEYFLHEISMCSVDCMGVIVWICKLAGTFSLSCLMQCHWGQILLNKSCITIM